MVRSQLNLTTSRNEEWSNHLFSNLNGALETGFRKLWFNKIGL